jgi:KDO2-lipid IV(A) lauroyltransferase
MKTSLSHFLQWKLHLYLYLTFGWTAAKTLIFCLGRIYFLLNQEEKKGIEKAVIEVIGRRRPAEETKRITKKVFDGIFSHYYEKIFIAFEEPGSAARFLKEKIVSSDLVKLDEKLAQGRGVIIVTGHYGAIEYIPTLLAVNHLPVSMIARFKSEQLKRRVYTQAEKYHIKLIDAEQRGNVIGAAISELRKNRILVTQCDEIEEWRPSAKEKISFLGRVTGLDRTLNTIHKRTGAEVVFAVIHRHNLLEYRFIARGYEEMLRVLQEGSQQSVGKTVLKFLEQCIYVHPEQWYQWKKYGEIRPPVLENRYDLDVDLSRLRLRPFLENVS